MKTFKEFCEQAAPSPFANYKPDGPVKGFVRGLATKVQDYQRGIQNKLQSINKTATNLRLAAGIYTDPRANYMQRDQATKMARMRLRGINPDNPSRMPIIKDTSGVEGSLRFVAPPPPKKGFGGKPTTEV